MYDTVFFTLPEYEANGVDFLSETPCFLENVAEHNYQGIPIITGKVGGLRVSASRSQIKVKDGSLCKFFLGNNFQTLGRRDTQLAIEKLSDLLHLPMKKATVTRMDVAQNFILKHPPEVYFRKLGALKYANRLQQPNGLYYILNGGRLCFYDKNKEQKTHRKEIPELYQGRNALRYERRHAQRLASQFNVEAVTGATLYNEGFYIMAVNQWKEGYQAIQKINDITLNFQVMKTKQQMYKMGVLALTEQVGGQLELMAQINDAQKRGEISKKQAYDLRTAVNQACQLKEGFTAQNEAIEELTKKIAEAARFYR